jgi:hypothetical protein
MQRLSLLIICFVAFFINACQKKNEPSPPETGDKISSMSVSSRKINDVVTLDIAAFTLKGTNGPGPTTFEQAEVWISEELSGYSNMKLNTTTTSRTVKLENLKADKTYYAAVKGIKNGVKSDFSKPIMFSTRSLKPVETLLDFPFSWTVSSSDILPYLAYVDGGSGEVILRNWKVKSDTILFKNSASKSYQVKGFYGRELKLFLETTRNREPAYDYFSWIQDEKDPTKGKYGFTEIVMPFGVRIWNCAFAPDGRRIAYTDYNKPGLFIFDIILNNVYLYSNETFFDFCWSADAKNIIETRNLANSTLDARELVKWDLGDSKKTPEKIFDWPDPVQHVLFSPQDDYALFASTISNNADLWIYELKTGKTWQISDVANFGWLSDKEFFVNANKTGNETSWKTYKYTMP